MDQQATEPLRGMRNSRVRFRTWCLLFLVVFFCFLVFLRASRITADPPPDLSWSAGYYGDEAGYAHNARNKVLFGKWVLDEYNPYLVNPILTIFDYLFFKTFHPSILTLRLVALFWGVLGILFVFRALKICTESLWMALFGVFLLETNYFYLMFSRIDLSDTMLANWMLMTLFFWAVGLKKGAFRLLVGLSAIGVLACKPTAAYFSMVVLAALIFDFIKRNADRRLNLKEIIRYCLPFLIGITVGGLVWAFAYYIPHHSEFAEMASGWSFLSMPRDWHDFVRRTVGSYAPIVFKHFSWFPFLLLVGWLYLPISFYRLFKNWRGYNSLEFLVLVWFALGYFAVSGLRYRPPRYFISLVPPFVLLALFGIRELLFFDYKTLRRNRMFCIGYLAWLYLTFFLARKYIHVKPSIFLGGMVVFLIIGMAVWGYFKIGNQELGMRRLGVLITTALIALSVFQNAALYYKWWHKPSYQEVNISREVGKIVKHGIIAGLWAPMVCMENNNRALCIAWRWFNDRHPYEKYHFTYLFLWRGNRDAELRHVIMIPLGMKFIKERLKPVRTFSIKNATAVLFKVIP